MFIHSFFSCCSTSDVKVKGASSLSKTHSNSPWKEPSRRVEIERGNRAWPSSVENRGRGQCHRLIFRCPPPEGARPPPTAGRECVLASVRFSPLRIAESREKRKWPLKELGSRRPTGQEEGNRPSQQHWCPGTGRRGWTVDKPVQGVSGRHLRRGGGDWRLPFATRRLTATCG